MRGIWELYCCNFSVNQKLFQNKKLKKEERHTGTDVLSLSVVGPGGLPRSAAATHGNLRTKLALKVAELEDGKAWIFDDAVELLNKLTSPGAALHLDSLFL